MCADCLYLLLPAQAVVDHAVDLARTDLQLEVHRLVPSAVTQGHTYAAVCVRSVAGGGLCVRALKPTAYPCLLHLCS